MVSVGYIASWADPNVLSRVLARIVAVVQSAKPGRITVVIAADQKPAITDQRTRTTSVAYFRQAGGYGCGRQPGRVSVAFRSFPS